MPISYSIDTERGRLLATAQGPITYSEIVAHLEKERKDRGLPYPELIEAMEATAVISAAEVRKVVERLRELGRRNALGPTAVVTDDDVAYGLLRMLEFLVEDVCDVRPFRDRHKAEVWLDAMPAPRPPTQLR